MGPVIHGLAAAFKPRCSSQRLALHTHLTPSFTSMIITRATGALR